MELGKKIASLRKAGKFTQAQLAEYLAVLPQTISRWEVDGGTPDVMLLPKIAAFFEVSIDELFGVTDMEHIENQVYKYSVLRDEKTFEEVMRSIDIAANSLSEELKSSVDKEYQELLHKREQLLAWKVHMYIQKSRKAMEDAKNQLDELLEETDQKNPLYLSLQLQKQQLRIQSGEAKKVLQEMKGQWNQERSLNSLYCYLMGLLEIGNSAEILQLWENDEVQVLVSIITEQTEPLWLIIFASARMEQNLSLLMKYSERFEKEASEQARFDAEWELVHLYNELDMQQEKQIYKEKVLDKLGRMHFNEYLKDVYLKKLEEL